MEWMLMPYRRYADFSGRLQRKEYWMFALFQFIVAMVLLVIMFAGGMGSVNEVTGQAEPGTLFYIGLGLLVIFGLGSFIPSLAVSVRRFHDQDKSGWFLLLQLIPYIGGIVVLVFMCLAGTPGPNRFGPDPKDPTGADVFS
jgi:uncharacterized membrane protein YhaH (DUF805 family)